MVGPQIGLPDDWQSEKPARYMHKFGTSPYQYEMELRCKVNDLV